MKNSLEETICTILVGVFLAGCRNSNLNYNVPIKRNLTTNMESQESTINNLRSRARIYLSFGEYKKAQPLFEKALDKAKTTNSSDKQLALCFIDLSYLYLKQGNLVNAEKMCKKGLEIQEKDYFEDHPYVAYTLRTLSSIYREQGNYSKSRSSLEQSFVIMSKYRQSDDPIFGPFLADFAELLVAEGKFSEAENYYQKSIDLINKNYGQNHLYTAEVLSNFAKLYKLERKDEEANNLINQAELIRKKVYGLDYDLFK